MPQHSFALGQAGTGKTTWLIGQIKIHAPQLVVGEQQRILGLTFMHGARRRLDAAIRIACPSVRASISTIDGFALSIVNRWRSTLQLPKVVTGCQGDHNFEDHQYSMRAGFDQILKAAAGLIRAPTIAKILGCSYPLIVIDEFQDCHGERLGFVQQLGQCTRLIVAADEFQLLDVTLQGCPAVDWARQLHQGGNAALNELQQIHRTADAAILESARCLRAGNVTNGGCIPVQCFDGHGQAAYRILEAVYWKHPAGQPFGTRAIITPSRSAVVSDILTSLVTQCQKHSKKPLRWRGDSSEADIVTALVTKIVGDKSDKLSMTSLQQVDCTADPVLATACSRLLRLCRLKGLATMPRALVMDTVERAVHGLRSFGPSSPSCVVTTVHGAKNREFDDVFVVWPYQIPPGPELQRRLLYNAVTRAKRRCILLVQGGVRRAQGDRVLQLLGVPVPIFTAKKKSKVAAKPGGKKQK